MTCCINNIHDPPLVSACFLTSGLCRSVGVEHQNGIGRGCTLRLGWHPLCQGRPCYIPASLRRGRGGDERGGEGKGRRGRSWPQMVVHSTSTRATCRTHQLIMSTEEQTHSGLLHRPTLTGHRENVLDLGTHPINMSIHNTKYVVYHITR